MSTLRVLTKEDAFLMREFFSDSEISNNFKFTRFPFSDEKMMKFVENSWYDQSNIHFAIDADEYAGTISLKNINLIDRTAEYAIVLRRKYWGTGVAREATQQIINFGFNVLNLEKIYLNVLANNGRANKFYQKMGFDFECSFKRHVFVNGQYEDLNWYCIFK